MFRLKHALVPIVAIENGDLADLSMERSIQLIDRLNWTIDSLNEIERDTRGGDMWWFRRELKIENVELKIIIFLKSPN